jgi:hypothetical protein
MQCARLRLMLGDWVALVELPPFARHAQATRA